VITWSFVLAVASAGEVVVSVDGAGQAACAVAIDGQARGNTPLHVTGLAPGSHAFTLTCLDRDPWTEKRDVVDQPTGFQQLVFQAPPPKSVTTPVEVYLVVRDMTAGEKVKIDGGDPVPLPYHARLVPGPHEFVILSRGGAEVRRYTKEVLGNPAGVVLKLD
jgi:hypothetical protein